MDNGKRSASDPDDVIEAGDSSETEDDDDSDNYSGDSGGAKSEKKQRDLAKGQKRKTDSGYFSRKSEHGKCVLEERMPRKDDYSKRVMHNQKKNRLHISRVRFLRELEIGQRKQGGPMD